MIIARYSTYRCVNDETQIANIVSSRIMKFWD